MNRRLLFSLFQPRGLINYIMALLTVGLFIMLDTLGTMYMATFTGAYLALAIGGISLWISLLLMMASLARHVRRIKVGARQGLFLSFEFVHLCGLLVCTVLVILPGVITDLLAWILYLPPFRLALGGLLFRRYRSEFGMVYEDLQASAE